MAKKLSVLQGHRNLAGSYELVTCTSPSAPGTSSLSEEVGHVCKPLEETQCWGGTEGSGTQVLLEQGLLKSSKVMLQQSGDHAHHPG